jgi:hypothetical protein
VATLVAPYRTGRWAPWIDSSLGLTFRIRRPNFPAEPPSEVPSDRDVQAPAPGPTGRLGVHITMTTTPRTSWGARLPTSTLKRGTALTVHGRTAPPARLQWIKLRYYGPGHQRTYKTLARVRTDRNGRFRLDGWKPRRVGAYELWAFYTSQRKGLVSDYACPQTFKVAK